MSAEEYGVAVLGGINEDIVAAVRHLPLAGQTVPATEVSIFPGGKGLNQAVAAARYGGHTAMIGAVGDDGAGASLVETLRQAGCATDGVAMLPGEQTGRAFISLSEEGENTIIVNAGANMRFDAAMLRASMPGRARVSLTQFEAAPDAIAALFAQPGAGVRILNAAPALVAHHGLLHEADIVILNETELAEFCCLTAVPQAEMQIVEAARTLITRDDQAIIVTLGARGSLLVERASHHAEPAHRVEVVDTIGAGDCFCGVFAAALAHGLDKTAALRWASAAAAISVGRRGAATSSPMREEIEAFLDARQPAPA